MDDIESSKTKHGQDTVHLAWHQAATGQGTMSNYYLGHVNNPNVSRSHVSGSSSLQWTEVRHSHKEIVRTLLLPHSAAPHHLTYEYS